MSQSPLKIIHCVHSVMPGGITRVVTNLIVGQKRLGHHAYVGTITEIGVDKVDPCLGEIIDTLPGRTGPLRVAGLSLLSVSRLANYLSAYDIVHVHGYHPVLYWAAIKSTAKVVHTFHGPKGSLEGRSIRRVVKRQLFSRMINKIDALTAVSKFVALKQCDRFGLSIESINVIYNCTTPMPPSRSRMSVREKYNISQDALVIGGVGQLVDWKRWEKLIKAIQILRSNGQNSVGFIVGDGPEIDRLKQLAQKFGVFDSVIFPGFSSTVANEISAMDLMFHTAIGEGFGLVIVETMSCGVPVMVLSDCGGALEIINKNDFPLVASSVEDAARIVIGLTPEKLGQLSKAALRNAALFTDISSMTDNYFEVYRSGL